MRQQKRRGDNDEKALKEEDGALRSLRGEVSNVSVCNPSLQGRVEIMNMVCSSMWHQSH